MIRERCWVYTISGLDWTTGLKLFHFLGHYFIDYLLLNMNRSRVWVSERERECVSVCECVSECECVCVSVSVCVRVRVHAILIYTKHNLLRIVMYMT